MKNKKELKLATFVWLNFIADKLH